MDGDDTNGVQVPASHVDLLEQPLPATLVTLMPDGRAQASVVWLLWRNSSLSLNTERGRRKTENMEADPRVTLLVIDPSDQHRYIELRCDVTRVSADGALEHRALLDAEYLGPDHVSDPANDRDERVVVDLRPVRVNTSG